MATREEADQAAVLIPWQKRAQGAVDAAVADAKAHALNGDMKLANDRLGRLGGGLKTLVQSARSEFYIKAFRTHRLMMDPEILIPGIGPTEEGNLAAQRALIKGKDHGAQVDEVIARAQHGLALAYRATQAKPKELRQHAERWHSQHKEAIGRVASQALSTSQVAIFHAVGKMMIRPELR
jgi:hypothetical protein